MNQTVAVVIATYGDKVFWDAMSQRAIDSVRSQTRPANEIIRVHEASLSLARNTGVQRAVSDWIICLDADDELDERYIEKMLAGDGDIRQPSTLGIVEGIADDHPVLIAKKPLIDGNYIVIGAMFNRSIALKVGGFRDLVAFEDWDLWVRMVEQGAHVGHCPDAIYKVHVRQNSRNQQNDFLYHELKREYASLPNSDRLMK